MVGIMIRPFLPVMVLGALLMSTLSGLGSTNSPPPPDQIAAPHAGLALHASAANRLTNAALVVGPAYASAAQRAVRDLSAC